MTTPFDLALSDAGFIHAASPLDKVLDRKFFSASLRRDAARMPERGGHFQGTLNLHVELYEEESLIDIRLEGVHPTGHGYEVVIRIIPLSDIEDDFAGALAGFEKMLVKSWLATCPEE